MSRAWPHTLALLALVFPASAALRAAPADEPSRLRAVTARFQRMIDEHQIAGAVLLVAHHHRVVLFDALGFQAIEPQVPMRRDTIFQVMSQTKSVTAAGIMVLVDEGRLRLSDPIEKYLPEFRGVRVQDGGSLRAPQRPVTVEDLLAQTSGIAHEAAPELADLLAKMDRPLDEVVRLLARHPLVSDPGRGWSYCSENSVLAGRIIEIVSGESYEHFLRSRLLEPLGMKDSFFFPEPAHRPRIAMSYRAVGGRLEPAGPDVTGGDPARFRAGAVYPGPEFGLYATAEDMAAFHLMMLNRGAWQGRRILSPAAVAEMTAVHTGDLPTKYAGSGWGLGWHVVRAVTPKSGLSVGTFGHGGGFGTYAFVDPSKALVGILMIQSNGTPVDVRGIFTTTVNAAIDPAKP